MHSGRSRTIFSDRTRADTRSRPCTAAGPGRRRRKHASVTYRFAIAHSLTLSSASLVQRCRCARHNNIFVRLPARWPCRPRRTGLVGSSSRGGRRTPAGRRDVGRRLVERGLRPTQRARRNVDPATVEAAHRDGKTGAFAVRTTQHRISRHPHPLEHHLRRRLRIPAHLLLMRAETQPRTAFFDNESRYPARTGLFWATGSRHHHIRIGGSRPGDELLDAVQHIVCPGPCTVDAPPGCSTRHGIRARTRLGQAVAGNDIHRGQPRHPRILRCSSVPNRDQSSMRTCCGWIKTPRWSDTAIASSSKIRTPSRRRNALPPTSSRQ